MVWRVLFRGMREKGVFVILGMLPAFLFIDGVYLLYRLGHTFFPLYHVLTISRLFSWAAVHDAQAMFGKTTFLIVVLLVVLMYLRVSQEIVDALRVLFKGLTILLGVFFLFHVVLFLVRGNSSVWLSPARKQLMLSGVYCFLGLIEYLGMVVLLRLLKPKKKRTKKKSIHV